MCFTTNTCGVIYTNPTFGKEPLCDVHAWQPEIEESSPPRWERLINASMRSLRNLRKKLPRFGNKTGCLSYTNPMFVDL